MYKELNKYKTGKKINGQARKIKLDGTIMLVEHKYDEYHFTLGELMQDFIKHQTKPFWRRKFYHSHLTKIYRRVLDEIEFKTGI